MKRNISLSWLARVVFQAYFVFLFVLYFFLGVPPVVEGGYYYAIVVPIVVFVAFVIASVFGRQRLDKTFLALSVILFLWGAVYYPAFGDIPFRQFFFLGILWVFILFAYSAREFPAILVNGLVLIGSVFAFLFYLYTVDLKWALVPLLGDDHVLWRVGVVWDQTPPFSAIIGLGVVVYNLFSERKRSWTYAFIGFGLYLVLFSFSRAALLALFAILLVYLLKRVPYSGLWSSLSVAGLAVFPLMLPLGLEYFRSFYGAGEGYVLRGFPDAAGNGDEFSRFVMFRGYIEVFEQAPILGCLGGLRIGCASDLPGNSEMNILKNLSEYGLIGSLGFVAFFSLSFFRSGDSGRAVIGALLILGVYYSSFLQFYVFATLLLMASMAHPRAS